MSVLDDVKAAVAAWDAAGADGSDTGYDEAEAMADLLRAFIATSEEITPMGEMQAMPFVEHDEPWTAKQLFDAVAILVNDDMEDVEVRIDFTDGRGIEHLVELIGFDYIPVTSAGSPTWVSFSARPVTP